MAPPASKETALHLYRALLRTASYMPSSETRAWVSSRITHRFRRFPEMSHEHYKSAKQMLGQLERATHGDMPALTKVLKYTYGRAGPRRRELLSAVVDLLHKSDLANPPTDAPLKPRKARLSPDHNRSGLLTVPTKEPSPFLTAYQRFLNDQQAHKPVDEEGRNPIKFIDPPIPKESVWMRPTAVKLERGIVKRWVASSLDNVIPPMPGREWEYLKSIATGAVPPEVPPQRRTRVGDRVEEGSMLTVDNLKYSIRRVQQEALMRRKHESRKHHLTPKFLQRLYASIWMASAKMEWNDERKRWDYTWGARQKTRATQPVPRDKQLFEGLENLQKTAVREPQKSPKWQERKMHRKRGIEINLLVGAAVEDRQGMEASDRAGRGGGEGGRARMEARSRGGGES